jgi:uncharacterized membrane protein YvbJ
MSKYCTNCGAEVLVGANFCRACGEQIAKVSINENSCSNCGFTMSPNEKFCTECGTQVSSKFNTPKSPGVNKEDFTTSIKQDEIISKKQQPLKKKKRSFLGCLGKSLLAIVIILVIGTVIIWNLPEDNEETIIDTNIPGIVDIEDDTGNYETNDQVNSSDKTTQKSVIESNSLSKVTKSVEDAFEKADTVRLKRILSSTSLKMYEGSFAEIEPYMNEYSKAFKKRKLVHSSQIYALYSFKDKEGNEHTAKFANDGSGTWKLIHF